ncbi:MAG: pyridoxamine kinase [Bacteroidales bacterium]|nr:pyridoxamine kinase [Bacteroidales bacterium]
MQKKLAIINDIAGYGRCAMTVLLPIISYLGVQACPLLTSIFSSNTAFPDFFMDDYTDRMEAYLASWEKIGLKQKFDGIATGYLGSVRQIEIVKRFVREFSREDTLVIVDPVMGDHGRLYSAYTVELCKELRELVALADIVTPNLTEACHLADMPYKEKGWKRKELSVMAERLAAMGPSHVVITGIPQGEYLANYVFVKTQGEPETRLIRVHKAGTERCSTGDVFTAVVAADAVNGVPFDKSVRKAAGFVKRCVEEAVALGTPPAEGVPFEAALWRLRRGS